MEEIIFWMEDAADSGVKKIADKVAGDVELVTDRRPRVLYGTSQEELADVAERAETVIVPRLSLPAIRRICVPCHSGSFRKNQP